MPESLELLGSGLLLVLASAFHLYLHVTRRRNRLAKRLLTYINRGSAFKMDSALLIIALGFFAAGVVAIATAFTLQ